MTPNQPDRLDRIEINLEIITQRLDTTDAQIAANSKDLALLNNLLSRTFDLVGKVNDSVKELRAGQEENTAILNYLLRKEREQQNGDSP